jgi:hypothetical protein
MAAIGFSYGTFVNTCHWFAYQGCFSSAAFTFSDGRRVLLLEELISDGGREHMAGNVPGRSGKGQYGKREKYKGCD